MKIAFDIHVDSFSGPEWRMLLIREGMKPLILSKSWKHFQSEREAEKEVEGIVSTLKKQIGFEIIEYEKPVQSITPNHKTPTPRADVFG